MIGHSKNPDVTYQILTNLLEKTEERGKDATGFWCAQANSDKELGKIAWDKAPIKSSVYVKNRESWKGVKELNPSILIAHCRLPTKFGDEKVNSNNHPHVSDDCCIGLVHNGKIPEYNSLKTEYATESSCDSEVLLRIFEHGEPNGKLQLHDDKDKVAMDEHVLLRLNGIKDIFSKVNFGAMAVAIGEYLPNGVRHLWLFRDEDRPLHLIDLREQLGQIFFCSTSEIWEKTVQSLPDNIKNMLPTEVIVSPPLYVWNLHINSHNNEIGFHKFQIEKSDEAEPSKDTVKKEKKSSTSQVANIITESDYKSEDATEELEIVDVDSSDTQGSTNDHVDSDAIELLDAIDSENAEEAASNEESSEETSSLEQDEYIELVGMIEQSFNNTEDPVNRIIKGENTQEDVEQAVAGLTEMKERLEQLERRLS